MDHSLSISKLWLVCCRSKFVCTEVPSLTNTCGESSRPLYMNLCGVRLDPAILSMKPVKRWLLTKIRKLAHTFFAVTC